MGDGASIDEGAFADPTNQKILVCQLCVDVGNGLARNTELLGQQAGRRQLRACCQATALDRAAQLIVQLPREILSALDDNMKFHTAPCKGIY